MPTVDTAYQTLGALVTSDSSGSYWKCTYLNGSLVNAVVGPFGGSTAAPCISAFGFNSEVPQAQHDVPITFQMNIENGSTLINPIEAYIQYVRVWTCAGWQTGVCPGSTLYGPDGNGLAYFHN